MSSDHDIAIVGLAGQFPGARDTHEYWNNLCGGVECVAFPTDDELLAAGVPRAQLDEPNYVKAVALAPDVQNFDAAFFGYTPREAAHSDPQIRMFLEAAHSALEDAGYNPYGIDGQVGVYATAGLNRYVDLHLQHAGDRSVSGSFMYSSLNSIDYVTSTVAYRLGLRGPAITVATACSSSLVAVHLAAQALRSGECDMAVAGGAEVELPLGHGYLWEDGGPVSRDGHVRPFDVKANGTLFGSGCGAVVLKRLVDAVADGDSVLAVVRGSAVNNDGADKAGFSAPSPNGQTVVIAEALTMADVAPEEVSYVEAHATGTSLGDPIEVAALDRAFRTVAGKEELASGSCALSSVKGNVGHLGHAAGIASLIKAVLALRNEQIPATANFTEANPELRIDRTPFRVTDRVVAWPRRPDRPRYVGIDSFGVGGMNCHVVLEEGPAPTVESVVDRPRIVVWSAKSENAELAYRDRLAAFLRGEDSSIFPAAVATLQEGRRAYPIRRALVAADAEDAANGLAGRSVVEAAAERREVAFAFPGQGSQQVAMAAGLYGTDEVFTRVLDEIVALFDGHGIQLAEAWRGGDTEALTRTTLAQPLLFAVEYALASALIAKGVRPAVLIGHSVGELIAAAVSDVVSLPDAVALVAARARAMAATPPGAMLAVAVPVGEVAGALPDGLTVAVVNGPRQTVLAGSDEDVSAAAATYASRGVACTRLATSGAFHTPGMAGAAAVFAEAFQEVRLAPPSIPLYSAAMGRRITDDEATDGWFWADQLANPVRFDRAMDALFEDCPRLLVEVGPGRTLTRFADRHPLVRSGASATVSLLPRTAGRSDADVRQFLTALARVWTEGHDLDWPEVRQHEPLRRVSLPGYVYQRSRHWVDAAYQQPAEPERIVESVAHPTQDRTAMAEPGTPLGTLSWVELDEWASFTPIDGSCLALLPDDPGVGLPYVLALQRAGLEPVIVRPGSGYAEVNGEFRARPDSCDDLTRVLAAMASRGAAPRVLVHGLAIGEKESASVATVAGRLGEVFFSALALLQAGTHGSSERSPRLLVLTSRSLDVTGAEPIDPIHAMLHGFIRSVVKESPQLGCRLVDIGPGTDEDQLAGEITRCDQHDVIALRGTRRWMRTEVPFVAEPVGGSAIRHRGVYLITGGLGGLGLAVARGLAGTGLRPRLVLLGRTGLIDDGSEHAVRVRAQVSELESLGAEVRVVACDVTDRRTLRREIDTATARYGPINGVLQLAGVAGDGLAQLRSPGQARAVLIPKVDGTLELAETFANRPPLDFFVCFSSRAATDGLVGSADYAAANAFQDAFAQLMRRSGTPALSINWPAWARVGMAAEFGVRTWAVELSVENCPMLDEHRVDGVPVLPGTAHIDLALRAYRDLDGYNGPVRLKDVLFHQAMTGREARVVEIRLHPDGRFESWSRPAANAAADPVRHATGVVSSVPAVTEHFDLDVLRKGLPRLLPVEEEGDPRLFTLGPRWHNYPYTWALPDEDISELLVHIELPEEFVGEIAHHAVHPALLDSATGSTRRPGEQPHLPLLYNELYLYEPLPAHFFSHIRRRTSDGGIIGADVDMIGPDGRLIARAIGYTMRRVEGRRFIEESSTADRTASVVAADIEPREGARLFMSLLVARHPGQILVESGARPLQRRSTRPGPRPGTDRVKPIDQGLAEPLATALVRAPDRASAPEAPPTAVNRAADPVMARLTALWAETFGHAEIGVDEDYFDLGGTSLSAVELMTKIRGEFGVDVSIAALFDHPTITLLAQVLQEQGAR